ncbi:sulfatase-like hydrolase/transferase [Candidatus Pelagisphaera phototrophica]|uniref:sulfatase-like hydrolase/transferase n=1 Tax=Candidatus Pelagisphaera phototrophica TaxID=2684113 RepID=UPI0019E8B760|nr:sulfatase-like hydrolase/transferase [Candidatus Pelagisphaera phototrophica]QXD30579.1 sulfatase-like hydrolase/transferase [Candidatus Pelagisphaera phototrophica]
MKISLLAFGAAISLSTIACADHDHPNLVIIMTDDQGYADVGFNGCEDIPTPNIDRIAHEGVRFTNGYVTYSVCSPSRAGLITGRYQGRFGHRRNPTLNPFDENAGLPLEEENMAEILKKIDYHTGYVGKWHLGTHPKFRPNARGFDEFYGFESGGHRYFPEDLTYQRIEDVDRKGAWYNTKLLRNDRRVETDEYLTDEFSHEAVDFINKNQEKPFLLFLSYNAPHTPMQASQKYLDRFTHIENKLRRTYAAMVSAVDDGVGRVLDTLAEADLEEDTLVFFLSDNGGAGNNGSINRPLRDSKGTIYEGGQRVPFAFRWTGTIQPGSDYHEPVSSMDILGTIAGLTRVEIAADRPLDGVNLVPYITGKDEGSPHTALFWQMFDKDHAVVRVGNDKFIGLNKQDTIELYDLSRDKAESQNLAKAQPEKLRQLQETLDAWTSQLEPARFDPLGTWNPPGPAK